MKKIASVLKGDGSYDVIYGTKKDNIFYGDFWGDPELGYPDAYNGRGGDDFIVGFKAADRLWGGQGNDHIYGGVGSDRIYGGPGKDTLSGEAQTDIISGGSGADTFLFTAHPDGFGASHLDIITDFDPGERGEKIQLVMSIQYGLMTFADLKSRMVEDGGDVVLDFDGLNILVLENLRINELSANDFQIRLF